MTSNHTETEQLEELIRECDERVKYLNQSRQEAENRGDYTAALYYLELLKREEPRIETTRAHWARALRYLSTRAERAG